MRATRERAVAYLVGSQAVLALAALVLASPQRDKLHEAILDRGPLSPSGVPQNELDVLVDLVFVQALVVCGGLCLAGVLVARGLLLQRSWAETAARLVALFVPLYAVAGIFGDVVPPAAKPALLLAAILAAGVALLLRRPEPAQVAAG